MNWQIKLITNQLKKLGKKLCPHDWEYRHATYKTEWDRQTGNSTLVERRTCRRCGKVQIRDEHLLGLNPPKLKRTWIG